MDGSPRRFPVELRDHVVAEFNVHRAATNLSEFEAFWRENTRRKKAFCDFAVPRLRAELQGDPNVNLEQINDYHVRLMLFLDGKPPLTKQGGLIYNACVKLYKEWVKENLPMVPEAERLENEARTFWEEYRARLLAVYETEFLPWANAEEPNMEQFSKWLTNGKYSFVGFFEGEDAKDKGFDLSLFQDAHETQTVQVLPSISVANEPIGAEVNVYFEANEHIRARSDFENFLEKLEVAVLRFFESPNSGDLPLASSNALQILYRTLDGWKKALSPEQTISFAQIFSKFVKANPWLSGYKRAELSQLLGRTLSGEVDEAVVGTAFDLAGEFEVDDRMWNLHHVAQTDLTPEESRQIGQPEKIGALEKEGWFHTVPTRMLTQYLTSIKRSEMILERLLSEGKIGIARKFIRQLTNNRSGKVLVCSVEDPFKSEIVWMNDEDERNARLNDLIGRFEDPGLKKCIEKKCKDAWAIPDFNQSGEGLSVRAFWLKLVNTAKEKNWPQEIIDALYDNAVEYDYGVGG